MVLSVPKVPSIDLIFKKDKDGNYNSKALLYQDIIRFCLVLDKKGQNEIKIYHLTSWLLDHNKGFAYSKPDLSERNKLRSSRLEDRTVPREQVCSRVCSLQIMDEIGSVKQAKGDGTC